MSASSLQFLLHGIDTVQCAYYLFPGNGCAIDFEMLAYEKEKIRHSKSKSPAALELAGQGFLLQPFGSGSGYPFILENEHFKIECGEFNHPAFFVTFRSQALWEKSAWLLHEDFLSWASKAGLKSCGEESLSRVDFSFDYHLPIIDFCEDNFKSRSTKDSKHRDSGKTQTFTFGKGDIVLRVYNKVAEIEQQSYKVWFFLLWGRDTDVWRIEWQIRKPILKKFGINTFNDLAQYQGELLRYLAEEHDTLRVPNADSNSSRWPLHPLWQNLQHQISQLHNQAAKRVVGQPAALEERMQRMAISIYGYLKRIAAIRFIQDGRSFPTPDSSLRHIEQMIGKLHDPLSWEVDVDKRIKEIMYGQW